MNGFHFATIFRRRRRWPQPRRVAISTALVVLGLVAIGLARFAGSLRDRGSSEQINSVWATRADSPSWDRVRPTWPRYLPELPVADPGLATVTPAALYGPATTVVAPPSIAAGPELFAPTIPPLAALNTQPQSLPSFAGGTPALPPFAGGTPALPSAPPPLLASRPAEPAPAVEPPGGADGQSVSPPMRLPVTRPLRSQAMEKIAAEADQQIRHGFELASHGACFAARAQFTAALRLVAQGLDNDRNSTVHSQALSAAVTAMNEAQDFIPAGGKLEGELDLPSIVAGHRTPVLKNVPPQELQAMRALNQYFTFAQQQLALAQGQEVAGSMALGALGKLHAALAGKPNPEIVAPDAKAMVFFQSALLVCPRNYLAANDLGVLFGAQRRFRGGPPLAGA